MLEHYSPLLLVWAFTYFIHSSILIAIAFGLDRAGFLKKTRTAELVWRFALFGALITASAQLTLTKAIESRDSAKPLISDAYNKDTPQALTPNTLRTLRYPLPDQLSTEDQATATRPALTESTTRTSNARDSFSAEPLEISLPQKVRTTASYLVYAWLLIALLGCFAIYRSARYLNRLAAFFPDADKGALKRLLNRVEEHQQGRIQLKVSDQWNSPFVTPDNTICIPRWAYTNLNDDQRDAMLAHEVAHVLRRDPAWRLAMQTLSRLCFFQPLHSIAVRRLELLAELACDQQAACASGKPHELAEALYACARMTKTNHVPDLALAMSRGGSPLLKRITSLLDQDAINSTTSPHTRTAQLFNLSAIVLGLSLIVFSTPSFTISFEKGIPSLREVASSVKVFANEVQQQALSSNQPSVSKDRVASLLNSVDTVQNSKIKPIVLDNMVLPINQELSADESSASSNYSISDNLIDKQESPNPRANELALAEKGNVEAQLAVANAYWRGQGVAPDVAQASVWFKRAAMNGSKVAEKHLALLQEREQHLHEIAFYTEQYEGAEWNFAEMKCARPDFSAVVQNTVDIENMIAQVNEFASCFNRYGEKLNASKIHERVMPHELMRLMTDAEIEKALNRNIRAMATIRLTANLIAEEFMVDKQTWENRTREQFKGARSRDWLSLKRIAIGNESENLQAISRQTVLVKVDTASEALPDLPSMR